MSQPNGGKLTIPDSNSFNSGMAQVKQNAFYTSIDIAGLELNNNQLQLLKESLQSNKHIGHINFGKLPNNS